MAHWDITRRGFAGGVAAMPLAAGAAERFDAVILGGRIIDPESRTDRIANVGIAGGQIAAITAEPIGGRRRIDARGLVVAPGFIDLHAHGQDLPDSDLQARDGVTTALELEAGAYPVAAALAMRAGQARIHYGASAGHRGARIFLTTGLTGGGMGPGDSGRRADVLRREQEWAYATLDPAQVTRLRALLASEVRAGGLGIGLMPEYLPGADRIEVLGVFEEAAKLKAPIFTHVRRSVTARGDGPVTAMQEMIADAAATGAPLHICHLGSKAVGAVAPVLRLIHGARDRGIDITTEAYPYTAGSTLIGSALFDTGWQERIGGDYGDLEWPLTGERLTADSFARYRREQPGGWVILHIIPSATVDACMADPVVMIASDGVPFEGGKGHPRGAGTFARVLGHYVRERKLLPLMLAIDKMTRMPADRLAGICPAMKRKGRVQPGCDADLTLFDPATVADRATYTEPTLASTGIPYVMVAGTLVVDGGAIVPSALPGQALRAGAG